MSSSYSGDDDSYDDDDKDDMSLIKDYNLSREDIANYRHIFDELDLDHTGFINQDELKTCGLIGVHGSPEDLQLVLGVADTDGDGRISFGEFVKVFEDANRNKYRVFVEAFRVIDRKNHGFITEKDLVKTMKNIGYAFTAKLDVPGGSDSDSDKEDEEGVEVEKVSHSKHDKGMINEAHARAPPSVGNPPISGVMTLPQFLSEMGYTGSIPDHLDELSSASDSDSDDDYKRPHAKVFMSPVNDDSDSSSSSLDEDALAVLNINLFYLQEVVTVEISLSETLFKLKEKVAEVAKHTADHLRLYFRGWLMKSDDLTLEYYGVTRGSLINCLFVPLYKRLPHSKCFSKTTGLPKLDKIYQWFRREGLLEPHDALELVNRAKTLFAAEPNILELEDPINVVGDIHGQFFDLEAIFDAGGWISEGARYLFLGDYVDRGYFSMEVTLYLLAAKICFPKDVFLVRGNHENSQMTSKYGTLDECLHKYGGPHRDDPAIFTALLECFAQLPICSIIQSGGKKIFAVHGGLSPSIKDVKDIARLDRTAIDPVGPIKELMWNDPYRDCVPEKLMRLHGDIDLKTLPPALTKEHGTWHRTDFHPSIRGKDISEYSYQSVLFFLEKNKFLCMLRGHQVPGFSKRKAAYDLFRPGPKFAFPAIVTVFSAPNYTDKTMQPGGLAVIHGGTFSLETYTWALHPVYYEVDHAKHHLKHFPMEDFVQYLAFHHSDELETVPLWALLSQSSKVNAFIEGCHERGTDYQAIDLMSSSGPWDFLRENVASILNLSDDPKVRRLYKKRKADMVLWYRSYNFLADAIRKEVLHEMDPASQDDENWDGSAYRGGSTASGERTSDDDASLPEGWQMSRMGDGRVFYVNEEKGISQWHRPGRLLTAPPEKVKVAPTEVKLAPVSTLPAGWEARVLPDGRIFYVNHHNSTTTWEHPITGERSTKGGKAKDKNKGKDKDKDKDKSKKGKGEA